MLQCLLHHFVMFSSNLPLDLTFVEYHFWHCLEYFSELNKVFGLKQEKFHDYAVQTNLEIIYKLNLIQKKSTPLKCTGILNF